MTSATCPRCACAFYLGTGRTLCAPCTLELDAQHPLALLPAALNPERSTTRAPMNRT